VILVIILVFIVIMVALGYAPALALGVAITAVATVSDPAEVRTTVEMAAALLLQPVRQLLFPDVAA
jgi:hypothetical protein